MKLEDLNKTQIILLTLLVSFVTSIATGIVTVSLMEQVPQTLPQTINRVVERTVEKVVPTVTGVVKPSTVTKETTVVVKEDELITSSIENIKKSIVSVRAIVHNTEGQIEYQFVAWGTVIDANGTIITDSGSITSGNSYSILTSDNVAFPVKILSQDEKLGVAVLKVERGEDESLKKYNFTPATLGDGKAGSLGQSVIALGGKGRVVISMGVITGLDVAPSDNSATASSSPSTKKVIGIETNMTVPASFSGGPLIDLFGKVIGFALNGDSVSVGSTFVPVTLLTSSN